VHDISSLEARGIPGVIVATEAFREAADAQSGALGRWPRLCYVPHPTSSLEPAELHALADTVLPEVLDALLSS
jgi:hypothetical protein